MVDALRETCRVLADGGALLDLRPIASPSPIEIVTCEGVTRAGEIDGSPGLADDVASDRALLQVREEGAIHPLREERFIVQFYWDSLDGMVDHVASYWKRRHVSPSESDLEPARCALRAAGPEARVRSSKQCSLTLYRLLDRPGLGFPGGYGRKRG